MHSIAIVFVCLSSVAASNDPGEARDWELKNLARYRAGEINDAELGMANLMRSMADPSFRAEVLKMMNDPEVQRLLADPMFQKQARQALEEMLADPTFQEQARRVLAQEWKPSKTLATLLLAMKPTQMMQTSRTRGTSSDVKMETNADLRVLAQKLNPAIGYWDPLNLGSDGPNGRSEPLIGFLRHAEIKHGRVAMAAFVGYCVQANGIRWGIEPFKSITATSPLEQFDALPPATRFNLILGIGFLEGWGELRGTGEPHYMRGGKPGYYPNFDEIPKDTLSGWYPGLNLWDPFKTMKNQSPETKARRLISELNNGRLAMLGIMGFMYAAKIPGSIPLLQGVIPEYKDKFPTSGLMLGWLEKGWTPTAWLAGKLRDGASYKPEAWAEKLR